LVPHRLGAAREVGLKAPVSRNQGVPEEVAQIDTGIRRAAWPRGILGVWCMSNRRPSPRDRALRPSSEGLETRQLLSSQVTGTDLDGDTWALTLFGPGTMNVATANGSPVDPSVPSEINSITLAG